LELKVLFTESEHRVAQRGLGLHSYICSTTSTKRGGLILQCSRARMGRPTWWPGPCQAHIPNCANKASLSNFTKDVDGDKLYCIMSWRRTEYFYSGRNQQIYSGLCCRNRHL